MMYTVKQEQPMTRTIKNGTIIANYLMHITVDAISDIPEAKDNWLAGSRCDVLEGGGHVYELSHNGEWVEVNFYHAGGESDSTDLSNYYTKSQADERIIEKVAEIVAEAPEDFDTLKELSDWITSHEDSAAAMNTQIQQNANSISKKVDKVSGMGLSQNSFTNDEKIKLTGLANYDDSGITAKIENMAEQVALSRSTLGYQRKNLLMNNCRSTTKSGVTATINEDGSITLTGSNTGSDEFVFYWNLQTGTHTYSEQYTDNKKFLPNGKYIVSGGHDGVRVQVRRSENNTSDSALAVSENGSKPIFNVTDAHKFVWSRINIAKGADFSTPVTIYPMIRLAEIADDTYEPYRPSVAEYIANLEARISALENNE